MGPGLDGCSWLDETEFLCDWLLMFSAVITVSDVEPVNIENYGIEFSIEDLTVIITNMGLSMHQSILLYNNSVNIMKMYSRISRETRTPTGHFKVHTNTITVNEQQQFGVDH